MATAAKSGVPPLLLVRAWSADETFRPAISPRARLMPARSVTALHEGGRAQRERALVRLHTPIMLHGGRPECMHWSQVDIQDCNGPVGPPSLVLRHWPERPC